MFNIFLLDGVFYGCRTLLHTKLTWMTLGLKLVCLVSLMLVTLDLILMGNTLLKMMGVDASRENAKKLKETLKGAGLRSKLKKLSTGALNKPQMISSIKELGGDTANTTP